MTSTRWTARAVLFAVTAAMLAALTPGVVAPPANAVGEATTIGMPVAGNPEDPVRLAEVRSDRSHAHGRRRLTASFSATGGGPAYGAAPAALGDGPDWLPFKVGAPGVQIGCVRNNCDGGTYHSWWAIDFPADEGTPVYAAGRGTITGWNECPPTTPDLDCGQNNFGNAVRIVHPNGQHSWYGHLTQAVKTSGSVNAGDLIGYVGNSGASEGFHLHFEVRGGNGAWGSQVEPPPLHATQGSNVVSYPSAAGYPNWGSVVPYASRAWSQGPSGTPPSPDEDGDGTSDATDYCKSVSGPSLTNGCPVALLSEVQASAPDEVPPGP